MPNFLDEYLVKLGTSVDQAGFARFHQALREASSAVDANAINMAKSLFKAQNEIVAGFAAIGGAALGLVDKVAMADQEYRLFALHMYMSKDAARGLKIAMDALGQPLENLAWDPELRGRTSKLLQDQRAMAPQGDFDEQMRKIRDVRFEFTRMEVEIQYLGLHVVQDFMKALGMGSDDLLRKLREFNDWVTHHLPQISQWVVNNFMPVWQDIKMILGDVVSITRDLATLFDNIIGLISGDSTLTGVANFDKFARSVGKVVHWLALAAHFLLQIEGTLMGVIGGGATGGTVGSIIGGIMGIPGGPAGIAGGILAGGATGTAIGAAAGGAGGAAFDLMRHLGVGPFGSGNSSNGDNSSYAQIASGSPLIQAMMAQESGGRQSAVSSKGAIGLMQLIPGTARSLGVDPNDPAQNLAGGVRYMDMLLKQYNSVPLALAAYNAGPGRIDAVLAGKASLPAETQNYVRSIMGKMGAKGDIQIGTVTIHITQPNASPRQIQEAVTNGVVNAREKQMQRNLAEFADLSPSY
jgi:hypothetical protein